LNLYPLDHISQKIVYPVRGISNSRDASASKNGGVETVEKPEYWITLVNNKKKTKKITKQKQKNKKGGCGDRSETGILDYYCQQT